jgi:hypothetical protein
MYTKKDGFLPAAVNITISSLCLRLFPYPRLCSVLNEPLSWLVSNSIVGSQWMLMAVCSRPDFAVPTAAVDVFQRQAKAPTEASLAIFIFFV